MGKSVPPWSTAGGESDSDSDIGADWRELGDEGVEELEPSGEDRTLLMRLRRVVKETYASPSSESSLFALWAREPRAVILEEELCATPRLLEVALLVGEVSEEGTGDGGLSALLVGLEPSSSDESPPARARSSASKSAILR